MKVSPPWYGGVLEAGFAVVERHSPIESLVDLRFGAGEAEAAGLLGDLEAAAFHCTTLSLLMVRSCTKQQMRSRFSEPAARRFPWRGASGRNGGCSRR